MPAYVRCNRCGDIVGPCYEAWDTSYCGNTWCGAHLGHHGTQHSLVKIPYTCFSGPAPAPAPPTPNDDDDETSLAELMAKKIKASKASKASKTPAPATAPACKASRKPRKARKPVDPEVKKRKAMLRRVARFEKMGFKAGVVYRAASRDLLLSQRASFTVSGNGEVWLGEWTQVAYHTTLGPPWQTITTEEAPPLRDFKLLNFKQLTHDKWGNIVLNGCTLEGKDYSEAEFGNGRRGARVKILPTIVQPQERQTNIMTHGD